MTTSLTIYNVRDAAFNLLVDTIAHYNSNNRGLKDGCQTLCQYSATSTSEGCAIGRLVPSDEAKAHWDKEVLPVHELLYRDALPDMLSYIGNKYPFYLNALQALHDSTVYWTPSGISEFGLKHVEHELCYDWTLEQVLAQLVLRKYT